MGAAAVLPQVEALPGAEGEAPVDHGDQLGGPGQRAAGVGRHVVGPLVVVLPAAGLGGQLGEPPEQIPAYRRVRVLLDDQAGGGVLHEDMAEPPLDAALPHHLGRPSRHVVEPRARRAHLEDSLEHPAMVRPPGSPGTQTARSSGNNRRSPPVVGLSCPSTHGLACSCRSCSRPALVLHRAEGRLPRRRPRRRRPPPSWPLTR